MKNEGGTIGGEAYDAEGGLAAVKVRTCREVNACASKVKSKVFEVSPL